MRPMSFVLAAFLFAVSGAHAQPPPRDAAIDDRLDPMLAGGDWKGLEAVLTANADSATRAKHLNWMRRQVQGGGNFFMAQLYAQSLWRMAQADPRQAGQRQTAGEMLLYAAALVKVDGAVCEDRSAPERRLEQILSWNAPVLRAARALPAATKARLVQSAQALERATASRRTERDESLCQGGEAGLLAGLSSTGVTIEVIPLPGQPAATARNVVVAPPRGWKPAYRPQAATRKEQAAIRRGLPASLAALLK